MYEILVGLEVTDEAAYARYRAAMAPILLAHGGSFGVDVRVSDVLRPEGTPFNRLFTIRFPSKERHQAFFANPDYLDVRRRFFEPSVGAVHRLGAYGE
jgi:uncharacterized protein (DUF1330 family)